VLADYLRVPVLTLYDIPGLESSDIQQLLEVDPDAWSAITVSNGSHEMIIVNSNHRGGRPATDITHELAHLLLGHEPGKIFYLGDQDVALRAYNPAAEEEADWLAWTLLLPRDALVHIRHLGLAEPEACETYGVSQRLLRMRTDRTGVDRQFTKRHRLAT
jgi:Zn-dependent peptidase ImmA (M78 family)